MTEMQCRCKRTPPDRRCRSCAWLEKKYSCLYSHLLSSPLLASLLLRFFFLAGTTAVAAAAAVVVVENVAIIQLNSFLQCPSSNVAEIGMDGDPVDFYRRDDQGVFWCANCPLKTPHKRDLLRHIDAVHMPTQYPCYLCGRVLKARYLLERHTKKVHTGRGRQRKAQ